MENEREVGEVDDLLVPWAAGFFGAEGCILLNSRKNESHKMLYSISPTIEISQAVTGGEIDGDGCFSLDVREQPKNRALGYSAYPRFIFQQTTTNAIDVIEDICEENGIKHSIFHYEDRHDDWADSYKITISCLDSVKRFLSLLRPYLINKRKQADIMLEEIIPRIEDGNHLNKEGFLELIAWKEVLDSYKGNRANSSKYTVDYFEDLWDMGLPEEKRPDVETSEQSYREMKEERDKPAIRIDEW